MRPLLLPAVLALLSSCAPDSSGPDNAPPPLGQTVEINFTAVDQRKVNLAELKGKVVLIDFWATWCPPCVAEIPNVKAAYEKLHGRGFEIIGISLDSDVAKLTEFTKAQKMEWPEYCDGQAWKTALAVKYGIHGIPTMWLLDKEGKLQDVGAEENLESKVEKLLAK